MRLLTEMILYVLYTTPHCLMLYTVHEDTSLHAAADSGPQMQRAAPMDNSCLIAGRCGKHTWLLHALLCCLHTSSPTSHCAALQLQWLLQLQVRCQFRRQLGCG
jgi:hypothetical protein